MIKNLKVRQKSGQDTKPSCPLRTLNQSRKTPTSAARPLKISFLVGVLMVASGFMKTGALLGATDRPNIVVLLSDDHSLRDSTVYSASQVPTPNMDRLARAGMTFNRAFVASPSCASDRASLLTGLMPARHGAESNHQAPHAYIRKLPSYLQELGYQVVAFGKVGHYLQTKLYGFEHFEHTGFHDDVCIDAAVDWLRGRRDERPLALFVGTNWPHTPWPQEGHRWQAADIRIPPEHVDTPETRAWRANYLGAVDQMDRDFGKVLDTVDAVLGDDTFILQTSDHGAQWPFAKWNLYDEGIHVPMIVVWKEKIKAGSRTDAFVNWTDILPTLVEVAGEPPPQNLDGASFAGVLRGEKTSHRDRIFTTHTEDAGQKTGDANVYPIRSVRTEEWKYIRNLFPSHAHTTHIDQVTSDQYFDSWLEKAQSDPGAARVVQRYYWRPAEELYHLTEDPAEQVNLAGDPRHTATLGQFRVELDQWMHDQGDTARFKGTLKKTVQGKLP